MDFFERLIVVMILGGGVGLAYAVWTEPKPEKWWWRVPGLRWLLWVTAFLFGLSAVAIFSLMVLSFFAPETMPALVPFWASELFEGSRGIIMLVGLLAVGGMWAAHYATRIHRFFSQPKNLETVRPGILLLRSFRDDEVPFEQEAFLEFKEPARSFEEALLRRLPVRTWPPEKAYALARSSETLPPLGAHRLVIDDDDWQPVVRMLATRANRILLIWRKTSSLSWESRMLATENLLAKTIVVIPPDYHRDLLWNWKALIDEIRLAGCAAIVVGKADGALAASFEKGGQRIRFWHCSGEYPEGPPALRERLDCVHQALSAQPRIGKDDLD